MKLSFLVFVSFLAWGVHGTAEHQAPLVEAELGRDKWLAAHEEAATCTSEPSIVCQKEEMALYFTLPPANLAELIQMYEKCNTGFGEFKMCLIMSGMTNPGQRFEAIDQQCLDFAHSIRHLDWTCMQDMVNWHQNCSTACQRNLRECDADYCMLNCLAYDVYKKCSEKEFTFFHEEIFQKKSLMRKLLLADCGRVVDFKWPGLMVTRFDIEEKRT